MTETCQDIDKLHQFHIANKKKLRLHLYWLSQRTITCLHQRRKASVYRYTSTWYWENSRVMVTSRPCDIRNYHHPYLKLSIWAQPAPQDHSLACNDSTMLQPFQSPDSSSMQQQEWCFQRSWLCPLCAVITCIHSTNSHWARAICQAFF